MNEVPNRNARETQLARIRGLMAKTVANGCTEEEAASAAAAVDRLLAAYEIDLDEVSVRQQEVVMIRVAKTRDHGVFDSASAIARFTDCMVWYSGADIVYLGFKVDTEIAEYLTLVFKRAIDANGAAHTLFNAEYDAARGAAKTEMLRSFGMGMAVRLGERLYELKSKRDFTARTQSGRDLVMMKAPMVKAAFDELGLKFGKAGQRRGPKDYQAFKAGQGAGDRVAINQGVAGRAARQVGRFA